MDSFLEVRHNMEVAHRLFNLVGKCEAIHGHSMWVTLRLYGKIDDYGIIGNHYGLQMDFGSVKKAFRDYIDETYDHSLLLNKDDSLVDLWASDPVMNEAGKLGIDAENGLPGIKVMAGDPTTENLAKWIGEWAQRTYAVQRIECTVQETHVNAAGVILGGE